MTARTFAGLLVVTIVVGCTPAAPVAPSPSAEQPRPGGRVVLPNQVDLPTLQPVTNDTPNYGIDLIYARLVSADPMTGETRPELATWKLSADGRVYSFEIDASANWSDGRPIVAQDWLTTVRALARSKRNGGVPRGFLRPILGYDDYAAGRADRIAGIVADAKRLTVTLSTSFCPALSQMFLLTHLLPTQVFGKYLDDADPARNLDDAPENLAPTVASGPFVLADWRRNDHIRFRRNASYWRGPALLDEIEFKVIESYDRAVEELNAGSAHVLALNQAPRIPVAPHVRLVRYQQLGYTYLGWNLRRPDSPLRDRRIRHALAYGLDMSQVVKDVLGGAGVKVVAHHPPTSWAYPSGLNEFTFDPARAEELIRAAGYTRGHGGYYHRDGAPLALRVVTNTNNPERAAFLQLAADQYRAIGVRIDPVLEDFAPLVSKLTTGRLEQDAWIIGWNLLPDPDAFAIWHSSSIPDAALSRVGQNIGAFTATGLDEALEKGRAGPDCSPAARKPHYAAVNRILNEEQPYNFGWSRLNTTAIAPDLRGLEIGPFSPYSIHNAERWWLAR